MPTDELQPTDNKQLKRLTIEEFMAEYHRGSQLDFELDPRIDLIKPIYEQAKLLSQQDETASW